MKQVIKNRIVKTILWILGGGITLFLLVAAAIQIPYLQKKIVQQGAKYLTLTTGFPSKIEYIKISWFDELSIQGLKVYDLQDSLMFSVDELIIDFDLRDLLDKENRRINEAIFHRAKLYVIRDAGTQEMNISLYVKEIKEIFKPKHGTKKPALTVDFIKIHDSSFSFNDQLKDSINNGFDYRHFAINNIEGDLSNFVVHSDTTDFYLRKLSGIDKITGFELHNLTTNFQVSQSAMSFGEMDLDVGRSHISDSIHFAYNGTYNLRYFNDSVTIHGNLNEAFLNSKDIALFFPKLKNYNKRYSIKAKIDGKISNIDLTDLELKFGNESLLRGKVSLSGLPNIRQTFINTSLLPSKVLSSDLKPYIPENAFNKLQKFGNVTFTGNLLGFPSNFVAKGSFVTDLGKIDSDINLIFPEGESMIYDGKVITSDFDLGALLEIPLFGLVNMQGEIKGQGTSLEDTDFILNSKIESLEIKGYTYKFIETNARFAKEFFDGEISVNDPNLKFSAKGSVDLREKRNLIIGSGILEVARLKNLNLSKRDFNIQSAIDVNLRGLHVDSIQGTAKLNNIHIELNGRELNIDSLNLTSTNDVNKRTLKVLSPNIEIDLIGDYNYSTLFVDTKLLYREYKLQFLNNHDSIRNYYKKKEPWLNVPSFLNYNVNLNNINPIINLFNPDIYISDNATFHGNFSSNEDLSISLIGQVDTVIYGNNSLYNSKIELVTRKKKDTAKIDANLKFYSSNQSLNNLATTNTFYVNTDWVENKVDFAIGIDQDNLDNYARLFGDLHFRESGTEIILRASQLVALGENWYFDENNKLNIKNKEFSFSDFKLVKENQNITLTGIISPNPDKKLNILVNNFGLENINPLINKEFGGTANGFIDFQNLYNIPKIESIFKIEAFTIDQFLVGNLSTLSQWNNESKLFNLEFNVERGNKRIIEIEGYLAPKKEIESLNLNVYFDKASLSIIEPFVNKIFSEITGTASGAFKIKGTPKYPVLTGDGAIEDGSVKINYLNTKYQLSGDLYFSKNSLGVKNLVVTDENNSLATFSGGFNHSGFKNFTIDLTGQLNNFLVLNTARGGNDLYYGSGIATGEIYFTGPVKNMEIKANGITEKGTRIFIPIGENESIEQSDFIQFVNFNDTTNSISVEKVSKSDIKGINLELDLEITNDAYGEIIFDIKAGDIIRGRGNGKVKLQIDTQGDFNMFGDYEFESGGYNFTLYNIINKEFDILPESQISWSGDPYGGILDIQASYTQLASMAPLFENQLDSAVLNHPAVKRRYPTKVLLDLQGPLLSPTINFDIEIEEYPPTILVNGQTVSLETTVASIKNRIKSDEQELKRQVFSLVILRRFSTENAFTTGGSFGSSVSEFISNQLSYWITQVDENLEIDVDLGSLDQEAFNTFQLRLSYTFLDGRLRITRDGGFVNQTKGYDISSVAGDWTVEYLLTSDGKYRVKMFNKTNYNPANSNLDKETSITTGLSLLHTQSFNEIKELFAKARNKRKQSKAVKEISGESDAASRKTNKDAN